LFTWPALPAGQYDLTVSAPAFTGGVNPGPIQVTLNPGPTQLPGRGSVAVGDVLDILLSPAGS
jgi:hypothetical protein